MVPWMGNAGLSPMGRCARRDGDEKSHACLGLCHCVAKNPRGALVSPQAFAALCTAFASWSPRRLAQFPTLQVRTVQGLAGWLVWAGHPQ